MPTQSKYMPTQVTGLKLHVHLVNLSIKEHIKNKFEF